MNDMLGVLAAVLALAGLGGVVARVFKQPMVVGYVLAGMVFTVAAKSLGVGEGESKQLMELLGKFGITLLLFLVGLELPISELKHMGKLAVMVAAAQIMFTTAAGYLLGVALGFGTSASLYLAVAVTFSSTIVVVKVLSEKRDLLSLHGRLATGVLLVQDFAAIGILAILSGQGSGGFGTTAVMWSMLKTATLAGVAVFLLGAILPKLSAKLADSTELLFVVSLAWCFGYAALAASPWIGLSSEIGGFLAGLALANSSEHLQIGSRVRPLRDFFLILFFVWLGSNLSWVGSSGLWWPIVATSGFVLIISPFILMVILSWFGFRKRTIFLSGLTMTQISEFSLVLATYGVKVGHINESTLTVITMASVITMVCSTYLISHGDKIFRKFSKYLSFLESRKAKSDLGVERRDFKDHIILFGHNRTGGALRPLLTKMGKDLVVVDFDPVVVDKLKKEGIQAVYGDMADYDLYDEVGLVGAKLVISTVPDTEDNLQLLYRINREKQSSNSNDQVVIVTAPDALGARDLYKAGADYVLVPQSVGGEYLAGMLDNYGMNKDKISQKGKTHLQQIGVR